MQNTKYECLVIGASAGGSEAISIILGALPPDLAIPIIIVQHIASDGGKLMLQRLSSLSSLPVKEADEKERIYPGQVYLAPANYHLLIEEDHTFSLSVDEKVSYSRPAINVLFETAAEVYRERLVGIVLSGANADGAQGLKRIQELGGFTIVQNPETAHTRIMPEAALNACQADMVLDIPEIAPFLIKMVRQSK
jgi:two-component system chemotaxis response regulator CheB